jgi:hypothetical protein
MCIIEFFPGTVGELLAKHFSEYSALKAVIGVNEEVLCLMG